MENHQKKSPVKLSAQPWKLTLPGKVLAVIVCVLPFLTRVFELSLSAAEKQAYFLGTDTTSDFEQFFRQLVLLVTAIAALAWFCYERITLHPRRPIPMDRLTAVVMICMGLYLVLGLLSTVLSPYRNDCWLGIYMMYEGYVALLSYGILFAAAWYWADRQEVIQFTKSCLTWMCIVLGVLALLEKMGICYYNNAIVQILSGINGNVAPGDAVSLTFGNADYLGIFCAMLLPLMTSMISREQKTGRMILQILAAVLIAATLLLTKVTNAIVIGYGMTALLFLVWILRSSCKRYLKAAVSTAAAAAVVLSCFGFILSHSGDSFSEKLRTAMIGTEQTDTFQLLSMELDGNCVVLENDDTVFQITADDSTLSTENLTFSCNGEEITPVMADDAIRFSEPELSHCSVTLADAQNIKVQLGYPTPVELRLENSSWQAVGIGGEMLDTVPLVSHAKALQKSYTFLNGRVFVWANTVSVLQDCIFVGHGPCTSIYYLNQNDLPALLNIFGRYVLYNKPHNWYLQMAQDTGLISLGAVLVILVLFLARGFRKCFSKKETWNAFRTGLLFAVIGYCLCGIFNDSLVYHAPMFWFLLGLGLREMGTEQKALK